MKKLIFKCGLVIAFFVIGYAHNAFAAGKVLILPYQVNGDESKAGLRQDVPSLVSERLQRQGLTVISPSETSSLLAGQNVDNVDIATARRLGEAAGASTVVYGVFNQLGDGFTLDSRIVQVAGSLTPAVVTLSKQNMLELAGATDELAARVTGNPLPSSSQILYQTPPAQNQAPLPRAEPELAAAPAAPVHIPKGALQDVRVLGLRVMDPEAVLMRLNLRKGDFATEATINDEVKRIWDMGYFSDVSARIHAGPTLVFSVVEKPRISDIEVNGTDELDSDDIIAAMGTKTGTVLNDRTLSEDIVKIKNLYSAEGYHNAQISHRVVAQQGGAGARLILDIAEGNELYISEVKINGLKELDQGDIEEYMALRPRTLLSFFTGTGVLEEEHLDRDTSAIAAFGLNEGFVDIQVAAPEVQINDDGIVVVFNVDEGRRYKVKDVKFGGQLIDDEEKLLAIVDMDERIKDGEYFSFETMQEDVKKIKEYYGNQGYAFAEVEPKLNRDTEGNALVTIGYFVDKKQKVYIRRVVLEGNARTRDNVLLREMRIADGDMYHGAKMRRSTERLKRLGYFSAVDIELVPTEVTEEVDLKIKVKEQNTGSIMMGIGYSTYYSVGVSASIQERNLFGRGYWLQIQGFTSTERTSGTISFTNPRLFDTELLLGNDFYYTYDNWDDFTKTTLGNNIRFAYPLGEYTSISLGYRLERYTLDDMGDYAAPSIKEYEGVNWTSALMARIVRDTTDDRSRPTKGTITRLSLEYGGNFLGGTDNFVKAMIDWQGFHALDKAGDHVLRLRTRLGGVFQNTDRIIPVFERFYIGGIDTIRGFDYSDISPKDPDFGDTIGGDRMGVANLEYSWTFQKDLGLAIVPFIDAGFNIDSESMDLYDHIVATAGLELRWRSPMGDLRIAYGIPLTKDYSGKRRHGRFEFTMGHQF